MQRATLLLILAGTFGSGIAAAQSDAILEKVSPLDPSPGGMRLQNVSIYTTYYSYPPGGLAAPGQGQSTDNIGLGGSATLQYLRSGERSGVSFTYTPSYAGSIQSISGSSFNHVLTFNWNRHLTPRLAFNLSFSGEESSLRNTLFLPGRLASVAAFPATFDDLAGAIIGGNFTNNQLAALLTGAPLIESPAGMLIYGDRMLMASAQVSMTYSLSSRLTFRASMVASRAQNLRDANEPAAQAVFLLSHTTTGSADLGMAYLLTPATSVSLDLTSSRSMSNLQDAYSSAASVAVGHAIGRHWMIKLRGGMGVITGIRETFDLPVGPQYEWGGAIGYKLQSHTFLASVERAISDAYALGAIASISSTGAWNWSPAGRSWSVSANFGQQRFIATAFPTVNAWRAGASLNRKLGSRFSLATEYAYLSGFPFIGPRGIAMNNVQGGQHMARVSIVWSPGQALRQ